jgi:hypothetical protein
MDLAPSFKGPKFKSEAEAVLEQCYRSWDLGILAKRKAQNLSEEGELY